jgi:Putative beta-barrel porin 2
MRQRSDNAQVFNKYRRFCLFFKRLALFISPSAPNRWRKRFFPVAGRFWDQASVYQDRRYLNAVCSGGVPICEVLKATMFFRRTGWLCTATICQALMQAADGQVGATSPAPTPPAVQSEVQGPTEEQPAPTFEQQPQPETNMTPEQEPGWQGGLNQPLENQPGALLPPEARAAGLKITFGPIDIRPKMDFSVLYDDNITISSTNRKADFQYTISPGVFFGLGDYLQKEANFISLEYIPSLILFNHFSTFNTLDQHLRAEGQYSFARLKLGPYFEYDKTEGPNRDIGNRVSSEIYATGLLANYNLSERVSFDVDTDLTFSHYQHQIGSKELVNHDWLNYNLTPKVTVGVGMAFGALQPESGGTQNYQQGLIRARFVSTAKLTFNGNAGVEFREFPSGTKVTPVFGLSADYQLFPGTRLSISGSRSVTNSALVGSDNYTATRVSADISQHLIGNFFLSLDVGYENDAYSQTTGISTGSTAIIAQRQDNYFFIRPRLIYHLKDWADISVWYFYRDNESNVPTSAFRDNQVALEVGLGF